MSSRKEIRGYPFPPQEQEKAEAWEHGIERGKRELASKIVADLEQVERAVRLAMQELEAVQRVSREWQGHDWTKDRAKEHLRGALFLIDQMEEKLGRREKRF